jgi:hypothetical protein
MPSVKRVLGNGPSAAGSVAAISGHRLEHKVKTIAARQFIIYSEDKAGSI